MKKSLFNLSLILGLSLSATAQEPAGNSILIDYDEFQQNGELHYIDCGADASFNTGSNMTIEAWLKPYSSAWNQKVMGKVNGSFNSGYLFGIDQGKLYTEIWTPGQSQILEGFIPPAPEPYYWVHLSITYNGTELKGYINGELVGTTTTSGALAANSDPFIIGIAPWDLANFQFFGNLDEIRIWNVTKTDEEIKDNIFKALTGTEAGLVAYYDFNESAGLTLPDLSPNGNDGTLSATFADANWTPSRAVIGDATMSGQTEISGLWNALGFSDPRFVTTDNGLSLLASNIPSDDYIVFGHDNGNGVSTTGNPAIAPTDFEHTGRVWYVNNVGAFPANLIFDLNNAADGGSEIDLTQPAENYTLLRRSGTTGEFTPVAGGDSKTGNVITFSNYVATDGYYAIGVSTTALIDDAGIEENNTFDFSIFPNPAKDFVSVVLPFATDARIQLFDAVGRVVLTENINATNDFTFATDQLSAGVYSLLVTNASGENSTRQLIIE